MKKFVLLALLLFPALASAQIPSGYVQAQATVPILANGSFGAAWTNLSSSPQLGLLGCVSTFQTTVNGTIDSFGKFSVLLADPGQICPAPSTWTFTFSCYTPPGAFITPITVTGGGSIDDITSQILAAAPANICQGGSGGRQLTVETNGAPNLSQTLLNFVDTPTIRFTNPSGGVESATCATATSSTIGCAKPDNSTVTISGGVLSATSAASNITDFKHAGTLLTGAFAPNSSVQVYDYDETAIAPDSGSIVANFRANTGTGKWNVEVPAVAMQPLIQMPDDTHQFYVLYPNTCTHVDIGFGRILSTCSANGTSSSADFQQQSLNSSFPPTTSTVTFSNFGPLPSSIPAGNVDAVYAAAYSSTSGFGQAFTSRTCSGVDVLPSTQTWTGQQVTGLTGLTGATIPTAACSLVASNSSSQPGPAETRVDAVVLIVQYHGTVVNNPNYLNVIWPLSLNAASNTLGIDPNFPFGTNAITVAQFNALNSVTRDTTIGYYAMVDISDGANGSDCSVGGGTSRVKCYFNGTAWVAWASGSGGGDTITSPGSTITVGGTSTNTTLDLALGHANTWTGQQTFVAPVLGTPASGVLTNATGLPAASVVVGALANGMTGTTQTVGDNTTKLATDAFVIANAGSSGVTQINGSAGSFTFTGSGVSCTTTTCTFSGGTGSGTVSGQASGVIPLGTSATVIGNQSHLDDGNTTAGTITSTEPIAISSSGPSQAAFTYNATPVVPGSSTTAVIGANSSGQGVLSEAGAPAARICDSTNGACPAGSGTIPANANFVWACTSGCDDDGGGGSTPLSPHINLSSYSQSGSVVSFVNTGTNNLASGDWVSVRFVTGWAPNLPSGLALGTGHTLFQVLSSGLSATTFQVNTGSLPAQTTCPSSCGIAESAMSFNPFVTVKSAGFPSGAINNTYVFIPAPVTVPGMSSTYATNYHPLSPAVTGNPAYLTVMDHTNDDDLCTAPATVQGAYQTLFASAHTDGYKVVVGNGVSYNFNQVTGCSTAYLKYNANRKWLLSQGRNQANIITGQFWDIFVDTSTATLDGTDANMPSWGPDGQIAVGNAVASAIASGGSPATWNPYFWGAFQGGNNQGIRWAPYNDDAGQAFTITDNAGDDIFKVSSGGDVFANTVLHVNYPSICPSFSTACIGGAFWVQGGITVQGIAAGSGHSCLHIDTSGVVTNTTGDCTASPLTTKGDLYTFSTADARLPVGTDGQTLVADSTQVTGLRWTTSTGSCGAGNIPCTNTPNSFTGAQTIQTAATSSNALVVEGTTNSTVVHARSAYGAASATTTVSVGDVVITIQQCGAGGQSNCKTNDTLANSWTEIMGNGLSHSSSFTAWWSKITVGGSDTFSVPASTPIQVDVFSNAGTVEAFSESGWISPLTTVTSVNTGTITTTAADAIYTGIGFDGYNGTVGGPSGGYSFGRGSASYFINGSDQEAAYLLTSTAGSQSAIWSPTAFSGGTVEAVIAGITPGSGSPQTADLAVFKNNSSGPQLAGISATGQYTGPVVSKGTTFAVSGCTPTSITGGATKGSFLAGTTSCTATVTMGDSQTAPNGWICSIKDLTTPANLLSQTATTTTTATFTGTVLSSDKILLSCDGY